MSSLDNWRQGTAGLRHVALILRIAECSLWGRVVVGIAFLDSAGTVRVNIA